MCCFKFIVFLAAIHFFSFRINAQAVEMATITAAPKQLKKYAWGYNAQLMRGVNWKSEGFENAVQKLHPFCLRFPGGTNSNYWDWQTGWIKTNIPVRKEWKNLPENNFRSLRDSRFQPSACGPMSRWPWRDG